MKPADDPTNQTPIHLIAPSSKPTTWPAIALRFKYKKPYTLHYISISKKRCTLHYVYIYIIYLIVVITKYKRTYDQSDHIEKIHLKYWVPTYTCIVREYWVPLRTLVLCVSTEFLYVHLYCVWKAHQRSSKIEAPSECIQNGCITVLIAAQSGTVDWYIRAQSTVPRPNEPFRRVHFCLCIYPARIKQIVQSTDKRLRH